MIFDSWGKPYQDTTYPWASAEELSVLDRHFMADPENSYCDDGDYEGCGQPGFLQFREGSMDYVWPGSDMNLGGSWYPCGGRIFLDGNGGSYSFTLSGDGREITDIYGMVYRDVNYSWEILEKVSVAGKRFSGYTFDEECADDTDCVEPVVVSFDLQGDSVTIQFPDSDTSISATYTQNYYDLAIDAPGGSHNYFYMSKEGASFFGIQHNGDYHTVSRDWDNFVYTNDIPLFALAHNDGASGYVRNSGSAFNATTVGGHEDDLDVYQWTSTIDPKTGANKPEVSGPACDIDVAGYTNLWGTSFATPHIAGMAADMLSSYTWLKRRPYLVKAMVLGAAKLPMNDNIADENYSRYTINDQSGLGGVRFNDLFYNTSMRWITGSNSKFDAVAGSDGDYDFTFTASNTTTRKSVVLVWIEDGIWNYNNKHEDHPIGNDYDLYIFDPNGNIVGGSATWDNAWEMYDFTPSMVGEYTVKIQRYANRNTSLDTKLGVIIHSY